MKVVFKVKREPIEQFGMTRPFTHAPEIFQSFDNSGAEKLFPIAVHSSTRS